MHLLAGVFAFPQLSLKALERRWSEDKFEVMHVGARESPGLESS